MRVLDFGRCALGFCLASAMLSGCGGSQPPLATPGVMPQVYSAQQSDVRHNDGASWMAPDAASQDLLYTGNVRYVTIYSYPQGKKVGILRGFYDTNGVCADAEGDVFVTDLGYNNIVEYAHGSKKRKRILTGNRPVGCSVDPTTGNLAVSDFDPANGAVAIYKDARGKPTLYKDPDFEEYFYCGFDDKGNLFVDGLAYPGGTGDFVFAELPRGSATLRTVKLNQYIGWPRQVQFDGRYIAVGDQTTPVIYQFKIKGRHGTKVGTTPLDHVTYPLGSWIQGQTLIEAVQYYKKKQAYAETLFYDYPAGGKPTKIIGHSWTDGPNSATVSLAPDH